MVGQTFMTKFHPDILKQIRVHRLVVSLNFNLPWLEITDTLIQHRVQVKIELK